MTCITFIEKQEHLMRIEPIAGRSIEEIVAGLNRGVYEIRDNNEAVIEVASRAEIAQIWSVEETAAGVERVEFAISG